MDFAAMHPEVLDPRDVAQRPDMRFAGPEFAQEQGRAERQGRLRELAFETDPGNPPDIREHLQWELERPRPALGGQSVLDKMNDGTYSEADPRQALSLPKRGQPRPGGGVWEDDYVLGHPEHTYDAEGNIDEGGKPARDGFDYSHARPETSAENKASERERRANQSKRRRRSEG
jgi:hypothetical protein